MTSTFNKFKDTTIYGNFINDSSGTYIANALFNGNISCGGNVNVNHINTLLTGNLNIACDKADEEIYIGNKASLVAINAKKIHLNEGYFDNDNIPSDSIFNIIHPPLIKIENRTMETNDIDIKFKKGLNSKTATFDIPSTFNDSVIFNTDASFNKNILLTGNIKLGGNSKILNNDGTLFTSGSGFNSNLNNIKIGGNAALTNQSINSIAIGGNAGVTNQGFSNSINNLGEAIIGNGYGIAIGFGAGQSGQGSNSISIGKNCGFENQDWSSIAIGRDSGKYNQRYNSIAFGTLCGELNQGPACYALGQACGQENQAQGSIAIGYMCGRYNQGQSSIALGTRAGYQSQHDRTIIINANPNQLNTLTEGAFYINPIRNDDISTNNILAYDPTTKEVFYTNDISNSYLKIVDASNTYFKANVNEIRIGSNAGINNAYSSIAIGNMAGQISQQQLAISLGWSAGYENQKVGAIAIGAGAGGSLQGEDTVAIGYGSGGASQSDFAVAMGYYAGGNSQGIKSVAIGAGAGETSQGTYSIAIGTSAGSLNQHNKTIIINANDISLNSLNTEACYINPIRNDNISTNNILAYDPASKEVFYTNDISNTYLKIVDASNTYLKIVDASNTYLKTTNATSTYLSKTDATSTYLSKTDGVSLTANNTLTGKNTFSSIYTTNVYSRCKTINTNNALLTDAGGTFLVYVPTIQMPTALYFSYTTTTNTYTNIEQQPIFHIVNGNGGSNLTIQFNTVSPNTPNYPPSGTVGLYGRDEGGIINGLTSYSLLAWQSITITPNGSLWLLLSKTK